jgi:hypothetical protein
MSKNINNAKNPQTRRVVGSGLSLLRSCAIPALVCGILSVHITTAADWPEEKKRVVTEQMQKCRREWSFHDTELMSQGNVPHAEADVFVNNRPINLRLRCDDGQLVPVEVFGDSVLVNGKDLSGNLGSKTTHGANSPIIEDISNSQIATGDKSSINQQRSYTISISLSVALSLSVVFNLYFLLRLRKRKSDDGEGTKRAATRHA